MVFQVDIDLTAYIQIVLNNLEGADACSPHEETVKSLQIVNCTIMECLEVWTKPQTFIWRKK